MILVYWGSFRMGELISQEKHKFDPSSSLLPSDLQFKEDCLNSLIKVKVKVKVENEVDEV